MSFDDAECALLLHAFGQVSDSDAAAARALLGSADGRAHQAAATARAAARDAQRAADDAARAARWAQHADRLLGARPGAMRTSCPRCAGRGVLEQFRHRSGGACYRCLGAGCLS